MRVRPILLSVSIIFIVPVFSQDSFRHQNFSGLAVDFNKVGGLGGYQNRAVEYPEGSGKYVLNRLDFWVTGVDQSGDTVAFCSDIFSAKTSWFPGPCSISGGRSHLYPSEWTNFVEVSGTEISEHKIKYANTGYVAPDGIAKWPAALNVSGFPTVLAAYADADQDLKYDYTKGDYPFVPGQNNLFSMGSDSASLLFAGGNSSKLDMAITWFVPKNADSIPGTIFFRSVTCNRGNEDISGIRIAIASDFLVGDATDNYLTTDAELGALVAYNAPGPDAEYGNNWPAVGVGWLSEKAVNSIYFESGNDAVKGKPLFPGDYYFLSNSFWKTGKFLSFGGSGLDGVTPAKFVFSNATDVSQSNVDWDETPGTAGRRTGLIAFSMNDLQAKKCKAADGFVTVIPDAPDSAKMREALLKVNGFYAKSDFNVGYKRMEIDKNDRIFPNPLCSGETLFFSDSRSVDLISVFSIDGRLLRTLRPLNNAIKLDLPAGIYCIKTDEKSAAKVLIIKNN